MRAARRVEPGVEAQPKRRPARYPTILATATYPDWDTIYRDNVGRMYRLMFSRVGNRADAEDLTSQVFLTAYKGLRTSASVGEVRAYLLAVARSVLAEHWRRTLGVKLTDIDVEQIDPADFTDIGSDDDGEDARERATRLLAELPERSRTILTLRFLQGYTIRQAAAEMGVSVANAKVLQHRALRMAAGLQENGGGR